ncbi:NADH-quinone oxidoreductase [Chytriomyces sp. MP71]|nr:NADH-quinone oxidoreductase [Chytriomyces sp. MP71]
MFRLLRIASRCHFAPASTSARYLSGTRVSLAQIEVFIDGQSVKIEQGSAIIQACEQAGVDIPRFCYHERLAIAGNCRMCLVEIEKSPKPQASCAMPVMPGMKIKTNTPIVKKAREGVMEFLLANHPLDCPVCDQGGECDLQDQSIRFGTDRSRLQSTDGKRAVEDKNFGPLVKTQMTRCIQCTRCVRFANEVAGAVELGTSGRGNDMQIGTYVEATLNTEMSGNVIDLCPVGALTNKPYAFNARPWELKKTETIDILDAIGSNIRVDSKGVEVLRVVPRLNDDINSEWISDKTRFAVDGLKRQRLTHPLIRKNGQFVSATWEEALTAVSNALSRTNPSEIAALAGQQADAESLVALKDLFNKLGSENVRLDAPNTTHLPSGYTDFRTNYTVGASLNGVEEADAILLVGTNPRHEAAILNTRIRKAYLHNELEVGLIGEKPVALNYEYEHLGTDPSAIAGVLDSNSEFSKKFANAKKPLILVGSSVLEREDAATVLASVAGLADKLKNSQKDWKPYAFLQRAASWTAALDLGYSQTSADATSATPRFIYLLNADHFDASEISPSSFVVYQGHHGDHGASYADVILPGSAYTEKSATFVNTEGRTQVTRTAVSAPGDAREDWKIIRALAEVSGVDLGYDETIEVRQRLGDVAPSLVSYDLLEATAFYGVGIAQLARASGVSVSRVPFSLPIRDFYMTDPISRSSVTMAKASKVYSS